MAGQPLVKLTACPYIILQSHRFTVVALVECERLECGYKPASELVSRVLTGEFDPLDVRGEERLLLYATLYGGLILAYKSEHYGLIPLARHQSHTRVHIEESHRDPPILGDQSLLELWARIIVEGPNGLCFTTGRERVCFGEGPCRLAPVGYEAWLPSDQQE